MLEQREVRRAFGEAPHAAIAGKSTASTPNAKSQVGILFLEDLAALRAMHGLSEYSLLIPVRPKSPQEVRDAFRGSWLGISDQPRRIQLAEVGERRNIVWADPCSERRNKLQFQGAGARPWIIGLRNGLARGI